jgi:hypothetical protein
MPDRDKTARATVRVRQTEKGPAVEIGVSPHINLERLLVNPDLINVVRGLRPPPFNCETCTSGVPLFIVEEFPEVISVDLAE